MSRGFPITLDKLPLFAGDEMLGEAVLGYDRRHQFRGLAELHEPAGMPKIQVEWGGRYVPAVRQYLDKLNGLTDKVPLAPQGTEGTFDASRKPRARIRREVAQAPPRGTGPVLVRE